VGLLVGFGEKKPFHKVETVEYGQAKGKGGRPPIENGAFSSRGGGGGGGGGGGADSDQSYDTTIVVGTLTKVD